MAQYINPQISGWKTYYGAFYKTLLEPIWTQINFAIAKWARRKYKKLKARSAQSFEWLNKTITGNPQAAGAAVR